MLTHNLMQVPRKRSGCQTAAQEPLPTRNRAPSRCSKLEPGGPSATVSLAFVTCVPADYLLLSSYECNACKACGDCGWPNAIDTPPRQVPSDYLALVFDSGPRGVQRSFILSVACLCQPLTQVQHLCHLSDVHVYPCQPHAFPSPQYCTCGQQGLRNTDRLVNGLLEFFFTFTFTLTFTLTDRITDRLGRP